MSTDNHIMPYFSVDSIPSNFLSYPPGATIECRPYSFGEQLNLQITGENNKKIFKNILSGVKCSFPKEQITPADCIYLGVYRKLVSTKHNKITVESTCPHCLHRNKHNFLLKDLQFKKPEFTKLPIIATLSDYKLYFTLMTVRIFMQCMETFNGEPIAFLASQVIRIDELNKDSNGDIISSKEIKYKNGMDMINAARKIIGNAIDEDKDVLDEVSNMLSNYGLQPLEVKCEDDLCENEYTIDMEDKGVLVYPFRDNKQPIRDRIKFGDESDNQSISSAQNES